jgi:hypothetical protein
MVTMLNVRNSGSRWHRAGLAVACRFFLQVRAGKQLGSVFALATAW